MLGARRFLGFARSGRRIPAAPSFVAVRNAGPLAPQCSIIVKRHASFPGGQFPGMRMPGQQPPEKGDTLKQYVSDLHFDFGLVLTLARFTAFRRASISLSSRSKGSLILRSGGMKVSHQIQRHHLNS